MITWLFRLKWSKFKDEWHLSRVRQDKHSPDFILELPDCENMDKFLGEGKELDKTKVYYFTLTKEDYNDNIYY